MVGAAEVEACRNELLQLKQEAAQVNADYKKFANNRVAQQQTMARLVQTVQLQSKDTPLVEDVIIVSLRAETAASKSQAEKFEGVEAPPKIDPANQPGGRVKSAEEAVAIYSFQIETLSTDLEYRRVLRDAEEALNVIYGEGIEEILNVIEEYCQDEGLTNEMQGIAAGGA